MKGWLAALAMMAAGTAGADPAAIRGAIGGQMEAFRAGDVETAFDFAAPVIRRMFRTSDDFGAMVRRGYPMVWRPEGVEYLGADEAGPHWRQDVLVTDAAGRLHRLEYLMVETADGWRIAGVRLLDAVEFGA
ncbi:DUF4864 domain-containing protein [Jannaschia rubra]|uniref:DUF4864 domain-containing protein n=1 Tax=Jannaschia rubra TaxID=282197 RepID=A0A0M6XT96_9RHOB|nr:DUF4864 domain-containing protein [Jannaschia rubra]CTQ33395.1 hypothetical protein JAN5088_02177 [Jannaschia rubra]SFG00760.1 protein of unknown function [Jannaschia rubra]